MDKSWNVKPFVWGSRLYPEGEVDAPPNRTLRVGESCRGRHSGLQLYVDEGNRKLFPAGQFVPFPWRFRLLWDSSYASFPSVGYVKLVQTFSVVALNVPTKEGAPANVLVDITVSVKDGNEDAALRQIVDLHENIESLLKDRILAELSKLSKETSAAVLKSDIAQLGAAFKLRLDKSFSDHADMPYRIVAVVVRDVIIPDEVTAAVFQAGVLEASVQLRAKATRLQLDQEHEESDARIARAESQAREKDRLSDMQKAERLREVEQQSEIDARQIDAAAAVSAAKRREDALEHDASDLRVIRVAEVNLAISRLESEAYSQRVAAENDLEAERRQKHMNFLLAVREAGGNPSEIGALVLAMDSRDSAPIYDFLEAQAKARGDEIFRTFQFQETTDAARHAADRAEAVISELRKTSFRGLLEAVATAFRRRGGDGGATDG